MTGPDDVPDGPDVVPSGPDVVPAGQQDDAPAEQDRPAPAERDEPAVLPDRAPDDTDVGWGERGTGDDRDDDWYERERPPHW